MEFLYYRFVIVIIIKCKQTSLSQCQPLPYQSPLLLAIIATTIIQAINFGHIRQVDYSSRYKKSIYFIASTSNN